MKHFKFYLTVFVALLGLGVLIYSGNLIRVKSDSDNISIKHNQVSQFRYIYSDFMGDHARYTFQTPPEEKNYADDCIGCEGEVGNAVIFAEFGCPEKTRYLFKSNSDRGVIEQNVKLDKDGVTVGERRLTVSKADGNIVTARIFWTEGNDFWAVQAPTVELAKALEESEEYYSIRKKLVDEIKSYVPIQNANTKIKKPC